MITAKDFYTLGKNAWACEEGLKWLRDWINKNPNGTAIEFFKSKKKKLKNLAQERKECDYFYWAYMNLVDWSNVANLQVLDVQYLGCYLYMATKQQFIKALIHIYKYGELNEGE